VRQRLLAPRLVTNATASEEANPMAPPMRTPMRTSDTARCLSRLCCFVAGSHVLKTKTRGVRGESAVGASSPWRLAQREAMTASHGRTSPPLRRFPPTSFRFHRAGSSAPVPGMATRSNWPTSSGGACVPLHRQGSVEGGPLSACLFDVTPVAGASGWATTLAALHTPSWTERGRRPRGSDYPGPSVRSARQLRASRASPQRPETT
jgi:hypothetical protein